MLSRDMEGRCNSQLATAEARLKTATESETGLLAEVQALTSEKKVHMIIIQTNLQTRDTMILSLIERSCNTQLAWV